MSTPEQARKWVVISALVVAGVWGYRRLVEGAGSLTSFPEFITGWGAVYFGLAMVTEAAPKFGGSFSILIMVADVLHNANPGGKTGLLADLNGQLAKNKTGSLTFLGGAVGQTAGSVAGGGLGVGGATGSAGSGAAAGVGSVAPGGSRAQLGGSPHTTVQTGVTTGI